MGLSHKPQSADKAKAKSYLVKWENYCVEEATWESVAMLKKSAAATIEEYWMQDKLASVETEEEKTDGKVDENAEDKIDENAEANAVEVAKEITAESDDEKTKEPALEIEETASGRIEEFWAKKNELRTVKKSPKIKSPRRKLKVDSENIPDTVQPTTKVSKRGRVIKPTSPMQLEPEVKKARVTSTKSAPKISPPKKTSKPASKVETKDEEHWQGLVLALKVRVEELEIINRPKDRTLLIELSRRTDLPRSVSVQVKAHLRDNPIQ